MIEHCERAGKFNSLPERERLNIICRVATDGQKSLRAVAYSLGRIFCKTYA